MPNYSEQRLVNDTGLSLYYRVYGEDRPGLPVLCLPGITRNSRDFEDIAPRMASDHPVICTDFRGRGFSDWDPNWRNYRPSTYVNDTLDLLDSNNIDKVVFFGTSLGGLVSTIMAATHNERVAGVILNDIGPEVGPEGLARIKTYIGKVPSVNSWDEAVQQSKDIYGLAWKDLPDDYWARLARRAYREDQNGVPRIDMDPMVGEAARKLDTTLDDPWVLFDGLRDVPTMVLHGHTSDILTYDIVDRMLERKPDLQHIVVGNRGHVPLLDEPESMAAIDAFLRNVREDANAA